MSVIDPPILALEQATFGYPSNGRPVMQEFSLAVRSGSITAILGPNGAGKTTLLHLLLGWLRPQSGWVNLNGRALEGYTRRELGQWMALVPQNEHIPFEYSVLEYALFGRTPYLDALQMPGEPDRQAALKAIDQAGLQALAARPVTHLSGGERQLVLVARALAQQPRILLMDEPTTHLDLANKRRLLDLLGRLNRQGVTVLMSTHEPEIASAIATDIVLMNHGRVLQAGPVGEVFTAANLSRTYGLEVEVHHLAGRRVVIWSG